MAPIGRISTGVLTAHQVRTLFMIVITPVEVTFLIDSDFFFWFLDLSGWK